MNRGSRISQIALLVRDYDEAIGWYTSRLGFVLREDTALSPTKRWVRISPEGDSAFCLLLARASGAEQQAAIGRQSGGRVFLFLETDDFSRDYEAYRARGVHFVEAPRQEAFGIVCVFEDLYGNRWDLIGRQ
jgi:catechol 2,3-dioxygenase-like lactoylglutathione lyase family enzyme